MSPLNKSKGYWTLHKFSAYIEIELTPEECKSILDGAIIEKDDVEIPGDPLPLNVSYAIRLLSRKEKRG